MARQQMKTEPNKAVLEWMPGSQSCLHSHAIGPAPLSTVVRRRL